MSCQTKTPASPEPLPPVDRPGAAGMTDAELAEAKSYGRLELACALADKVVDVAYLSVAAFLLAHPIDEWLKTYSLLAGNWTLRLMALFLVVMAIHIVVSFPVAFYSGHLLEHQFKLSTQTFGRWFRQYVKRNLLAVALSLAMVVGLYWLIWTTHGAWWLAAAGAFFFISVVLGQLDARVDPAAVLPD